LHLNLGHFVEFFCFVLFCFFPHWWDNKRTNSETPSPGLKAVGQPPKLLKLKLYCIGNWRFFHLFIFYFYFIFSLFLFLFIIFFQSSPCLSNACSVYCWFIHYFSLFISLKLFCLFCFFYLFICFSLFL
jgi:hypothetical protein